MGFFDITLDAANKMHAWGWRLSMLGAFVTALGVLLLTWGNRIRDKDFEEQVAVLHSRAAMSEERAAELEKDAARLRLDLQGLKLPSARTEQKDDRSPIATRHITPEQRTCLMGRLKDFRTPVVMRFEPDQEATEYAASLREAFSKAGVTVNFAGAARSGMTGTRLATADGEPLPGAAELSSVLQYCGIPLDAPLPWQQFPRSASDPRPGSNARPEEVMIFIGSKQAVK